VLEIIERILELVGSQSKNVILNYIQERYGMDLNALLGYKEEFTNYLREVLGDSADIIAAKINRALEEYFGSNSHLQNPLCYICSHYYPPEKMRLHLMHDHTKEEIAYYLAVIYVDDWREETELRDESDSMLRQLLHN
jgi:hypothetical protein